MEKEIRKIHNQSKQTYGARRLEVELRKKELKTSLKRIRRLMKSGNILSIRHRQFMATTNSNHNLPLEDNLLYQNFRALSRRKM